MKKIKNIVIVGGGTSGWTTATLLIDRILPETKTNITLIESKDVPIIGVGESTTGQMPYLINNSTYLNELDFLKATGSTFKYGIRHSDWKVVGHSFNSPLLPGWYNETRYPHESYDYIRNYHLAAQKSVDNFYHSKCMNQHKVFYVKGSPNNKYPDIVPDSGYKLLGATGYGYHMDAYLTSDYLRSKALNTGRINRIENTVKQVDRNSKGYVTSLTLADGSSVEGDLFIDCSGFSRLLKDKDNKFISYSNHLLVDTALIIPKQYPEDIDHVRTYTNAKAMKNGWMFEIPLQKRMGRGYNFSSKHTTKEEAHKELEQSLGEEVDVKNVISFEPGRLEKFWDKNVLHVGISSGFMEPLEATTIHISLKQMEHFMEEYYHNMIDLDNQALQNQFNYAMTSMYDDNRDFLIYHYHNTRQDTDFWKDASSENTLSEKLKNNMSIWKSRTPRKSDMSSSSLDNTLLLGTILYYNIAIGMSAVSPRLAEHELKYYNLYERAKEDYEAINDFGDYMIKRSMSSKDFYEKLREGQV